MVFRSELEALQHKLAEAEARAAKLENSAAMADALAKRVRELETERREKDPGRKQAELAAPLETLRQKLIDAEARAAKLEGQAAAADALAMRVRELESERKGREPGREQAELAAALESERAWARELEERLSLPEAEAHRAPAPATPREQAAGVLVIMAGLGGLASLTLGSFAPLVAYGLVGGIAALVQEHTSEERKRDR